LVCTRACLNNYVYFYTKIKETYIGDEYLEEDFEKQVSGLIDKKLVSKIFTPDLKMRRVDHKFAFNLLDKMINWDKKIIRSSISPNDEDVNLLFPIQDYFFYLITQAEVKDIDEHLLQLFRDMYLRVHSKHRDPYYEGFFNCLFQMILFRKHLQSLGEKIWIASWISQLENSLNRLNISFK